MLTTQAGRIISKILLWHLNGKSSYWVGILKRYLYAAKEMNNFYGVQLHEVQDKEKAEVQGSMIIFNFIGSNP